MPSLSRCVLALLAGVASADPSRIVSVFGHKSPDTDAVASALVYAWASGEQQTAARAFRLGALNPETEFVLKELGVETPPLWEDSLQAGSPVAVVDTNNPEELPDGIAEAELLTIVDHHKLSGLETVAPLEVDMRPLCSATSILYARALEKNLTIPKPIAGLMLAGILSDSLEFRSPTTTPTDRAHAAQLAELAGLDTHKFAAGMFDAKSRIDGYTAREVLLLDSKVYTLGSDVSSATQRLRGAARQSAQRLRISVLETTAPQRAIARREELVAAMPGLVDEEGLDDLLFFVIDIFARNATFLSGSPTATALVQRAFSVTLEPATATAVLPGVVSRKKQIVPHLEFALEPERVVR